MPLFRKKAQPNLLPDAEVRHLEGVVDLCRDGRGAFLTGWLEAERAKLTLLYENVDDVPSLRLIQGRSGALNDILRTIGEAERRLEADGLARRALGSMKRER